MARSVAGVRLAFSLTAFDAPGLATMAVKGVQVTSLDRGGPRRSGYAVSLQRAGATGVQGYRWPDGRGSSRVCSVGCRV